MVTARRCDDCGRFCRRLVAVWRTAPTPEIDREVCDDCAAWRGIVVDR